MFLLQNVLGVTSDESLLFDLYCSSKLTKVLVTGPGGTAIEISVLDLSYSRALMEVLLGLEDVPVEILLLDLYCSRTLTEVLTRLEGTPVEISLSDFYNSIAPIYTELGSSQNGIPGRTWS